MLAVMPIEQFDVRWECTLSVIPSCAARFLLVSFRYSAEIPYRRQLFSFRFQFPRRKYHDSRISTVFCKIVGLCSSSQRPGRKVW